MTECWALIDYRPGTAQQVLGVARATGFHVTEKTLHYNRLADLPNYCMFGYGLRGIAQDHRKILAPPYPELIISAGRRSAPVVAYIKARSPNTKLVHLMRPEWRDDVFDMVILPRHDRYDNASNVVTTLGAPHALSDELLFKSRARYPLNAERYPHPYTLICIGGNTPHGTFSIEDGRKLVKSLAAFAHSGTLLVTASRRTPPAVAHKIFDFLQQDYSHMPCLRYMPDQGGENPYHAWLAQAHRVIVTSDSVSMMSEAAFVAKPLYYFKPSHNISPKHERFAQQMVDQGHAKPISSYDPLWTKAVKLDEAGRLGGLIREMMGKRA
jgi:uncharacterized protein